MYWIRQLTHAGLPAFLIASKPMKDMGEATCVGCVYLAIGYMKEDVFDQSE